MLFGLQDLYQLGKGFSMPLDTITAEGRQVKIIDQTLLPLELKYIPIHTIGEMWEAIKVLRIRGAPAIGVAAAYGVYVGCRESSARDSSAFLREVKQHCDYLASSRPTAVNLFWALDRVWNKVQAHADLSVKELKEVIFAEAVAIQQEDDAICRAIGRHGTDLIQDGDGLLTHCNAGGLATSKYGTALAPMFTAQEQGKRIHVFADETRPLLQGARLTAFELQQAGIPTTLICDNMAATVMSQGKVQAVIVGTDRTTAQGDVANKIGTLGVAILAKEFGVPFYVAAPLSSIDMQLSDGAQIPIEERDPEEVTHGFGRQTAPAGIGVYNPAFDVTPHQYVTALITEKGVVYPPFAQTLPPLFRD
jgi:methylthioribose-1-phosphate isomerase